MAEGAALFRPALAKNINRARTFCFVLTLGSMLASCTARGTPPSVTTITPAQTVAIVPSIPLEFRVATEGLIVNHLDTIDDSNWRLNDLAFYIAAGAFAQSFNVSEVLPDTDLGKAESEQTNFLNGAPDLGTILRQHIHTSKPADVYIVFDAAPSADGELINPGSGILKGVGISDQNTVGGPLCPAVHTFLLMTVINGKSFKTIFSLPLRVSSLPDKKSSVLINLFGDMGYPAKTLQNFKWQSTWAAMSEDQQKQIMDAVDQLLATSIPYTLSLAAYCIQTASSACTTTIKLNGPA
jgi:hypothetical protein